MKKITLLICAFVLMASIPLASQAMDISDEINKASDSVKRFIKTTYQKFDGINVTGGIKNSKGRVTIKDSLKVNKVAILNGNLNVKGEIKNNLSGIPVKINDDMRVYGVSKFKDKLELGQIDFSVTDISSLDTSTLSGGDVFLNSADYKLYLWNGTSWVDLTQQNTNTTYTAGTNVAISGSNVISSTDTTYSNGNGLNLAGTEFSLNESYFPTWTGMILTAASTPFPCDNPSVNGAMFINSTSGELCICNLPFGPVWMVAGSVGLGTPTGCP